MVDIIGTSQLHSKSASNQWSYETYCFFVYAAKKKKKKKGFSVSN